MVGLKFIGVLCTIVLVFTRVQADSILEEGFNYVRRGLEQAENVAVSLGTPSVPQNVPVTVPAVPPPATLPPPPTRFFPPPPTQVTNRALLYNRPIPLAPGEYLVYRPSDMFDIVGAPPSININPIERVFDNEVSYRTLPPDSQAIFQAVGPAITSGVPKPAQQSFINLLTPDIKSVPAVSDAIRQAGLQGSPQAAAAPPPPPTPSASSSNYKVTLSIISLFVTLLVFLF